MKYVYPAIFEKEADGQYSVSFPDIEGAYTCGSDLPDAIYMAADCLGLVLYGLKEDKQPFPSVSDISNFANGDNRFASLVSVDLTEYKKKVDNKPIKKTLYIPKELNDQAEAIGVNFSDVLRKALKKAVNG
jgi:predicted RNase H-like HicB family nuclease